MLVFGEPNLQSFITIIIMNSFGQESLDLVGLFVLINVCLHFTKDKSLIVFFFKCVVHKTLFEFPTFIHEPAALAGTDQGLSSQYRKLFDISSR